MMIEDFNSFRIDEGIFSRLSKDAKSAWKKLSSFVDDNKDVHDGLADAIDKAGKGAVHKFLYDVSKESDLKAYNTSKNKARKSIVIARKRKEKADAIKARKKASQDGKDSAADVKKRMKDVEAEIKSKLGLSVFKELKDKLTDKEMELLATTRKIVGKQAISPEQMTIIKELGKLKNITDDDVEEILSIIKSKNKAAK